MDSPLQLKFFKKIELYQEYKFEEKKSSSTDYQSWRIEKLILKWTREYHHHLARPLSKEHIRSKILNSVYTTEHINAMGCLIKHGWANLDLVSDTPSKQSDYNPESITITKEGLLMGEVISDLEGNAFFTRKKYSVFFVFVWLSIFATFIVIVGNAFKTISGLC